MIRHIFLDMDNTLLDSHGEIKEKTAVFLRKIQIPVTLVSARAPLEMDFAIRKLKLTGSQVSFNGGLIFDPNSEGKDSVFSMPLEYTDVYAVLNKIGVNQPGISISWYTRTGWYATKNDKGTQFESNLTGFQPTISKTLPTNSSKGDPIYKIMIICFAEDKMQETEQKVNELGLNGVCARFSGKAYLEITNANSIKSNAIAYIQSSRGLRRDELAAFGDGQNDIEMFKAVGTPIAMRNASAAVKKHAKFVTSSNDQDGVMYGIKNYLL